MFVCVHEKAACVISLPAAVSDYNGLQGIGFLKRYIQIDEGKSLYTISLLFWGDWDTLIVERVMLATDPNNWWSFYWEIGDFG